MVTARIEKGLTKGKFDRSF